MKYIIRVQVAVFIFACVACADATPFNKGAYRPPSSDYHQVIQARDYGTIVAIESLYASLEPFAEEVWLNASTNWQSSGKAPAPRPTAPGFAVITHMPDLVETSLAEFISTESHVLFATLTKILADLAAHTPCQGVRFTQFKTRAYTRRTVIEISYGTQVVALEAFSNGPTDDEGLYVLDVVEKRESVLWSK
jgi:hypothetical protein